MVEEKRRGGEGHRTRRGRENGMGLGDVEGRALVATHRARYRGRERERKRREQRRKEEEGEGGDQYIFLDKRQEEDLGQGQRATTLRLMAKEGDLSLFPSFFVLGACPANQRAVVTWITAGRSYVVAARFFFPISSFFLFFLLSFSSFSFPPHIRQTTYDLF